MLNIIHHNYILETVEFVRCDIVTMSPNQIIIIIIIIIWQNKFVSAWYETKIIGLWRSDTTFRSLVFPPLQSVFKK